MTERYDGFDVTGYDDKDAAPTAVGIGVNDAGKIEPPRPSPTPSQAPDFRDRARRMVRRIKRSEEGETDNLVELASQFHDVYAAGMQETASMRAALAMYRVCVDAMYFARRWEDPKAVGDLIADRMHKIPDWIMNVIKNTPEGRT